MRGHVKQRGKSWAFWYEAGRDESGRRKQRCRSGFPTRKAAETALSETLADIARQEHVDRSLLTFGGYVDQVWWPHVLETRRPASRESYARQLRLHIRPVLGHLRLQEIAPTDIDRLYRACAKKGLAPATISVIAAITSAVFAHAKRKRMVVRNVAEDADVPKVSRRPRTIWTATETANFLKSVHGDRLAALWRLLALTGCRRGEALGLRWLDVDFESSTVTITQQVVPLSGELVLAPPKTATAVRKIPVDAGTIEALRQHRTTQELERAVLGEPIVDLDLVFTTLDGRPLDPRGISQAFQVRRKNAKLPKIRLHDLRHGAATLALEGDVNLELIRRRLGHSKIGTTVDLYARHEIESAERAAADTVAALLDGPR